MALLRGEELTNIMDRRINEYVPVPKEDDTNGQSCLYTAGGVVTRSKATCKGESIAMLC